MLKIAVVIPAYRVRARVLSVLDAIPPLVWRIYVVDDGCPEGTGSFVQQQTKDPRVRVLFNDKNRGVGGATLRGYLEAIRDGSDVIVKIDGDGQMDPALIPAFVEPIAAGRADYTKGNRFFDPESLKGMPTIRLLGNAVLSFFSKLSSGYWNIFDPTNGFTAIHASVVKLLPLRKIDEGFFFESSILFRLGILRAVVVDVPMKAVYRGEVSNLKVAKVILPFFIKHLKNFAKRIIYNYYLRDMSLASVELPLSVLFVACGFGYGIAHWMSSLKTGTPTTAGTVMVAALPIIIGIQLFLGFLAYDIASVPQQPLHQSLQLTRQAGGEPC